MRFVNDENFLSGGHLWYCEVVLVLASVYPQKLFAVVSKLVVVGNDNVLSARCAKLQSLGLGYFPCSTVDVHGQRARFAVAYLVVARRLERPVASRRDVLLYVGQRLVTPAVREVPVPALLGACSDDGHEAQCQGNDVFFHKQNVLSYIYNVLPSVMFQVAWLACLHLQRYGYRLL